MRYAVGWHRAELFDPCGYVGVIPCGDERGGLTKVVLGLLGELLLLLALLEEPHRRGR